MKKVPWSFLLLALAVVAAVVFRRPDEAGLNDRKTVMNIKEEWQNKQWDKARGIWSTDFNNSFVLVRASVEDVAKALEPKALRWNRDVLGSQVEFGKHSLFVFRLRGHNWTEVLANYMFVEHGLAQRLSEELKTQTISYSVSDTCGCIGYSLYESGKEIEEYGFIEGKCTFNSSLRQLKQADLEKDPWGLPCRFFEEQDAFEPGIEFGYFFNHKLPEAGQWAVVHNPGFTLMVDGEGVLSRPDFERVDYMVLRQ
jgi:hypothetical protein